jgi:hypothetical protein
MYLHDVLKRLKQRTVMMYIVHILSLYSWRNSLYRYLHTYRNRNWNDRNWNWYWRDRNWYWYWRDWNCYWRDWYWYWRDRN